MMAAAAATAEASHKRHGDNIEQSVDRLADTEMPGDLFLARWKTYHEQSVLNTPAVTICIV
jgi:hypothetical protein